MNLQEPCVCGGLIVACAPWDVMAAVGRHNATDQHEAWRKRYAHVEANRAYRARIRGEVATVRLARDLRAEMVA